MILYFSVVFTENLQFEFYYIWIFYNLLNPRIYTEFTIWIHKLCPPLDVWLQTLVNYALWNSEDTWRVWAIWEKQQQLYCSVLLDTLQPV